MNSNDSCTLECTETLRPQRMESSNLERAYPVLSLPPEIVSEIFANFLPVYPECLPNSGLLSPMLLCRICRLWREIALSTVVLWRAISKERLLAELELLRTWLARSRYYPLSLNLDFKRFNSPSTLVPQFLQTAVHHCRRWEHVEICMPSEHLHLIQGDTPLLQSLTFGPSMLPSVGDHGRLDLFEQAQQLKSVTLTHHFLYSLYRLPCAQLTHLDGYFCMSANVLNFSVTP
ncbi:F-box domain-containing protein [Mycena venus]|uniref:F-box domain-containing protein n=1 Tax=Mycena venus TaxID=2733690 RepID=A0A8H7CEF4_9AGAR|nr:F-box domain-containing protein [Mycena venus]